MNLFPSTAKKLRGNGHKVRAAISIASLLAFFSFLPAVVVNVSSPNEFYGILAVGYLLAFFFFVPLVTLVASFLGIVVTLFNDYAAWPAWIHWSIIVISTLSVIALAFAKYFSLVSSNVADNAEPTD